jgi:amino acid adenylation domain-containing protein
VKLSNRQEEYATSIAVIGKSGRFPGAENLSQFWRNLSAGTESISFFTDEELLSAGVDPELLSHPNYVKALGFLENADLFDAQFFGFTPNEAQLLDPQHRVFLECAWEALEDAGYASDDPGMVAVYASSSISGYLRNLLFNPEIMNSSDTLQILTGNDKDHIAMRVSYKLNLRGPSVCIQSACSSSLVAVHMGCRSLMTYECDIALAGGVSIGTPLKYGYLYQEGGTGSPDGHCRAFDAGGNGTVAGHGAGVVVLKRLFEAMEDGDAIQAIIRGSAVNNDGSGKVSYTAPSVDSQADVVRSALAFARVPSETITYVEAHGTGTLLGDPIELTALSKAFRSGAGRKVPCAIGSLKTNIGHLDAASGVAGLIKAILALEHKALPPSVNFKTPNPKAGFETSPFYVNTRLAEWNSDGTPRRAGVSSLGMGGTNVHLVLEEAPDPDAKTSHRKHHLLVFSAKTKTALECSTARIADHLQTYPDLRLSDVAHTLQVGRKPFPYRRSVVCESVTEAIERLSQANGEGLVSGRAEIRNRPVVFMFSGQGAQYPGMGAGLYRTNRVFREQADQCTELLRARLGTDLRPILYPDRPFTESDALQLAQTHITQPALFITEYALAKVWMDWGITPEAMIGHSIGEYVAACLSGVMSLEEALVIVAKRGALMQQTQPGTMLAISCSTKRLEGLVNGTVSVAAINSPSSCVVSGDTAKIAEVEAVLSKENISCQRLATSHAFHSEMMDPIMGQFQIEIAKIKLAPPKIPYISNLTGDWVTEQIATNPENWAQHLRRTVRFADGLTVLGTSAERVFLEVGPGGSLSSFVKLCRQDNPASFAISCFTRHTPYDQESRRLLEALGKLWTVGVQVDWGRQDSAAEARRISLPTYPFERHRYFVEPMRSMETLLSLVPKKPAPDEPAEETASLAMPALHSRPEMSNIFVAPRNEIEQQIAEVWQSVLGIEAIGAHDDFWELGGHSLLATQVVTRLKERFHIPLPIVLLFDMPTIEKLAQETVRLQTESANSGISFQPERESELQTTAIRRVDREGKLTLSFAQERLWFLSQLEPENVAYNMPDAVRVKGSLDLDSLERTLQEIVRRHELLRTRFVSVNGEPQQIIESTVAVQLPVTDLSHLPEQEREPEARRLALTEAQHHFDLSRGPLLRVKPLRLASQDHVLVFNMHHIVSDQWSVGILLREVSAIYKSFSIGRPSPLPELDIQYADFSAWQRELLSGPVLERQLEYWKRKLAALEPLMLPTDRPRGAIERQDGATTRFTLPLELTNALKILSRKQGATLYMVLLAAFQALLGRYSGKSDIAVGSPIAGRSRSETETLIGFFINMLVLRTDLSGRPDSVELLRRVKETTLGAHANQDVPFGKLVEELLPQGERTSSPLFQVMFVLQNVPWTGLQLGTAKMLPFHVETGAAQYDLSLVLAETGSGMECFVEYNSGLFNAVSITRMIDHYQMLLSGMVANPSQSIAVLPLLTADEREQIIEQWNCTGQEIPEVTVVELFQEQVQRNPAAVATICDERQMSYGELNERANQLSWYLRELGVGPDVLVGICMERSLDMLVGLLGILKAGGGYLPLDPDFPAERLRYMVEDSRPALLLTQEWLQQELMDAGAQQVLCLERDWKTIRERPMTNPKRISSAENLAYIIYTSGSTGRPKGVAIAHRALCNQLVWMQSVFGLSSVDRVLQKASFSFDGSVEEIFATLVGGAKLILAKPGGQVDIEYLVELIKDQGITFIDLPPSLLHALLQLPEMEACTSLRCVLSGGESLKFELQEMFFQKMSAELFNTYGPTETTVQSSYWRCRRGQGGGGGVPLGRPIGNTQLYVLDPVGEAVPVGVAGELCIAGAGLARGYLNHPELTAERFVPNPFVASGEENGNGGGQRLYRTGDKVRWRGDGNLEYLGRLDHQVKIRGFRIELGEIEAALEEQAGVQQAVVIAREHEPGDMRLVAYVVAEPGGEENERTSMGARLRISELDEHLRDKLPAYMVPSAYMQLEELPLNHNGKIDRKRLPQPDLETPEEEYVGPRHATEEALCRLWQQVLRRERVGIHDNFFRIGGHSLLAAQVAARMRENFQVDIPLRRMFEGPTIAQLAQVIDQTLPTAGGNGAPSPLLQDIKRVARKAALLPVEQFE